MTQQKAAGLLRRLFVLRELPVCGGVSPSGYPAGWPRPACSSRAGTPLGRQTPAARWGSALYLPARGCGRRRNSRCGTGTPPCDRGAPGSPAGSRRDERAARHPGYAPVANPPRSARGQSRGRGTACWWRHSRRDVPQIVWVYFAASAAGQRFGQLTHSSKSPRSSACTSLSIWPTR